MVVDWRASSKPNDIRRLKQRVRELERQLKSIGQRPVVPHEEPQSDTDNNSIKHSEYSIEGHEDADITSSINNEISTSQTSKEVKVISQVCKLSRTGFSNSLAGDELYAVEADVGDLGESSDLRQNTIDLRDSMEVSSFLFHKKPPCQWLRYQIGRAHV